jgi:hypothetical protein
MRLLLADFTPTSGTARPFESLGFRCCPCAGGCGWHASTRACLSQDWMASVGGMLNTYDRPHDDGDGARQIPDSLIPYGWMIRTTQRPLASPSPPNPYPGRSNISSLIPLVWKRGGGMEQSWQSICGALEGVPSLPTSRFMGDSVLDLAPIADARGWNSGKRKENVTR